MFPYRLLRIRLAYFSLKRYMLVFIHYNVNQIYFSPEPLLIRTR